MKRDFGLTLAARLFLAITIGMMTILSIVGSEAATVLVHRISGAENYPHKPIRIIDAFPAGGSTDAMARLIGQKFTERFGQTVVVENRVGATGNLGAQFAARAAPDGYTLFIGNVAFLGSSVNLYPHLGYDVLNDFAYLTVVAFGTYVMVISPSVPAKSVAELIALAKSRPGQLRYGSAGIGSTPHLTGEMFNRRTGIDLLHVPYNGAAPIIAAVAGGEVQVGYTSLAAALPLINAGRIRGLAVLGRNRTRSLPDLPTIAESGLPDFDVTPWYGLLAPAAIPNAVAKALNIEFIRIVQLPDVQATFANWGFQASGSTPERFKEIMRTEIETSAKIIKDLGIKLE